MDLWWVIPALFSLLFHKTKLKTRQRSYSEFFLPQRYMLFTRNMRIDFLAVPIFQTRKCFWLTVSEIRNTWNMWKCRISLICESICQYNNRYVKEWDYGQKTCYKMYVFFHLIFISGSSEALILLSDWKTEDSKWLGHTLQRRRNMSLIAHASDSNEGLSCFPPTFALELGFIWHRSGRQSRLSRFQLTPLPAYWLGSPKSRKRCIFLKCKLSSSSSEDTDWEPDNISRCLFCSHFSVQ